MGRSYVKLIVFPGISSKIDYSKVERHTLTSMYASRVHQWYWDYGQWEFLRIVQMYRDYALAALSGPTSTIRVGAGPLCRCPQ
jgi:hypothetical protein